MKGISIGLIALFFLIGCTNPLASPKEVHWHADFLVWMDGNFVDFNKLAYMSTPYHALSPAVHLHDFNPNVLHIHSSDATLKMFFDSLGMEFSDTCFDTNGFRYCNSPTRQLQLFVNGKQNLELQKYAPKDLDRILVFYDIGKPTSDLLDSVTSQACIYSQKCPVPPEFVLDAESCTESQQCTVSQQ